MKEFRRQARCAIDICRNRPERNRILCRACMKRYKDKLPVYEAMEAALRVCFPGERQQAQTEDTALDGGGGDHGAR